MLGKRGTSKQRTGEILGDRSSDRPAYQVHLANELDALLCLFIKLKHEAKDIARVDKTYDDDISRVRNLVVEDRPADARLDKLCANAFVGAVGRFRLPGATSQRIEITVVVFQDLQANQALQSQIDDRFGMGSEPFDPVLGVSSSRPACNFLQYWVQGRIACFRAVQEE